MDQPGKGLPGDWGERTLPTPAPEGLPWPPPQDAQYPSLDPARLGLVHNAIPNPSPRWGDRKVLEHTLVSQTSCSQ